MKNLLFVFLCFCSIVEVRAQKLPLTIKEMGSWPSIDDQQLSDDGKYISFVIRTPGGANVLTIESYDGSWKKEISGAFDAKFSKDSRQLICRNPSDSILIVDMSKRQVFAYQYHGEVFTTALENTSYIVYENALQDNLIVLDVDSKIKKSFRGKFENIKIQRSKLIASVKGEDKKTHLILVNLLKSSVDTIYSTYGTLSNIGMDKSGDQICFEEDNSDKTTKLVYYRAGMASARIVLEMNSRNLAMRASSFGDFVFSNNGNCLFFDATVIKPSSEAKGIDDSNVSIWSYTDTFLSNVPNLPSYLIDQPEQYRFMLNLANNKIINIGSADQEMSGSKDGKFVLVATKSSYFEMNTKLLPMHTVSLISTVDGSQNQILSTLDQYLGCYFSPGSKYVIWFNPSEHNYFCYNISKGTTQNITSKIPASMTDEDDDHPGPKPSFVDPGDWAWGPSDSFVLVNDQFDIWKVDPIGQLNSVNLTNGFGARNQITLRYINTKVQRYDIGWPSVQRLTEIADNDDLILSAFDNVNKLNGFFKINVKGGRDPVKLSLDSCVYYLPQFTDNSEISFISTPIKATNASRYIVTRMTPTEFPNILVTEDFVKFRKVSELAPQKKYNWYNASLVHWQTFDKKLATGILYKPENFDFRKKYPVIFYFYEKLSDGVFQYLSPRLSSAIIDIPCYVSNGYIVFVPDIRYTLGFPGQSALNYVASAAKCLSKEPWVDSLKMGLQGHSFGGYEVNYIISHTNIFKAAVSNAGEVDLISNYGSFHSGASAQYLFENGQSRIGATLWDAPDLYIKNSPIFYADKVETPVLFMANDKDCCVPYAQSLEWFLALRRLGKKAWLLRYPGEDHSLSKKVNELDLTIRMKQFFDYYLMDVEPPRWLSAGFSSARSND